MDSNSDSNSDGDSDGGKTSRAEGRRRAKADNEESERKASERA